MNDFTEEKGLTAEEQAKLNLAFDLASYNSNFSRKLSFECEDEGLDFDRLIAHDPKAYYAFMGVGSAPVLDIAAAHDVCTRYWRKVLQCYEEFKKGESL